MQRVTFYLSRQACRQKGNLSSLEFVLSFSRKEVINVNLIIIESRHFLLYRTDNGFSNTLCYLLHSHLDNIPDLIDFYSLH